ncbi:MAG: hypothetical protein V8S95_01040 [Odoribacter sp.]
MALVRGFGPDAVADGYIRVCGGIARYLAIAECWPVLEWLPVILTGGLLCNSGISFLDMLHIFLFFFILWGILSAPLGHLRTCIAVLFFPCLYLLLPWGVVLMFYFFIRSFTQEQE